MRTPGADAATQMGVVRFSTCLGNGNRLRRTTAGLAIKHHGLIGWDELHLFTKPA